MHYFLRIIDILHLNFQTELNDHHLIAVEWIKKDKIAFIVSNGSTIFITFDPTTCDIVEIVTDKFLQSKFQCEQLINGMS
jgi:hypothetical protein